MVWEKIRNAFTVLVVKPNGKRLMWMYEDNIKNYFGKIYTHVEWI